MLLKTGLQKLLATKLFQIQKYAKLLLTQGVMLLKAELKQAKQKFLKQSLGQLKL